MKYENLTQEEVDNLPLEMLCCFHILSWNKCSSPQTVEEWAEDIGWIAFIQLFDTMEDAKEGAILYVGNLYTLVNKVLARERKG